MSNHPNRSRARSPAANPTPEQIRTAREVANLTQTGAALLLHTTCRTWQQWEAGDRRMHPAFWELFRLKSIPRCMRCGWPSGEDWLDDGMTCPNCKLEQ